MIRMSGLQFIPGDYRPGVVLAVPVRTPDGFEVTHKGIQADWSGPDGFPAVIHNSKHCGDVRETSMTDFAAGAIGPVRSEGYPGRLEPWQVLLRARQVKGRRWSLTSWNCEHFTSWVHGFEPSSPQLQAGVAKASFGALGFGVGGFLLAALVSGSRA